ncbi:MAG TPA: Kiwa anti-phage protein KwaB-like domain-containing protein [Terriglobales bacterium]|nr:Kiwa anti-phage protein KwaB-like domain-containing protein [Terriglobales bacterium]
MTPRLDPENAATTEFGVGLENGKGQRFVMVPVDANVQEALREMVTATRDEMSAITEKPSEYEPSEKYGSTEHLHLLLTDELASQLRAIHEADNLPMDGRVLEDPSEVFCYFTRLTFGKGRRLTGVRRATTFKGILRSRLIRLATDALRIVEDKVFKLDNDFDMLIDNTDVYILRPSGFEFVGELQDAILGAVPGNVKLIQADLPYVDFSSIETYASAHPRAARYLASIRVQKETKDIDKNSLKKLCASTGVKVEDVKGKLTVEESSIMDFLGVLDRRLYQIELIKGSPESFRASSRSRIRTQ